MRFQTARKKSGITQAQIANEFGIDQSTVSLWESGKTHPRTKRLPKLAQMLGCSIAELTTPDTLES